MRISHLVLKNWKNFQSVDVRLSNRVFIVGPNACGKSNLLDVFRFLKKIALNGFREAVEERDGISKIRCLAARRYSDIEIDVELSSNEARYGAPDWRYSICFNNQPQSGKPVLKKEEVWHEGQSIIKRPDIEDNHDQDRLYQTALEQIYANKNFREIADFLGSIQYVHIVPQLIRNPNIYVTKKPIKEDPYGRGFLIKIAETNPRARDLRMKELQELLRIAIPQLASLELMRDELGTPHLVGNYKHWRTYAGQNELQFSDGTLRLIGFLWALLEGKGPLLLEEPELSLHSGLVKKLPSLMYRLRARRKTKKRQIVMSTHSAELLSDEGIDSSEILLLYPNTEGTKVQVATDKQEINALLEAGITVAEAVIPHTKPEELEKLDLFK